MIPPKEPKPPKEYKPKEKEEHAHHHRHDDDVKSFVFRSAKPFNGEKLEQFLSGMIQVYGPDLLRYNRVEGLSIGARLQGRVTSALGVMP